MKLHYLLIIALVLVFMVSCVAPPVPAPTPTPTPVPTPRPTPTPTPTPEPSPTPPPNSAPVGKILGPEELVFDCTIDRCEEEDIPDLPARAFRDADGKVQLISTHFIGRRMIGDTLDSVKHDCNIIMNSDKDPDPSKFNDKEWLASPYTLDGKTIYALIHNEYWGNLHPGQCPSGEYEKCVNTSITLAISTDKGRTYSHATAPDHLVATQPYPYEPDTGASEISCPSNIIYNPKDSYYYVMFYMVRKNRRDAGTGIMRTKTLDDPKSWRCWDGSDFTVQFINPYQNPDADPAEHTCQPVSQREILYMHSGLTFNTYFNKFILVGHTATGYTMEDRGVPGIYYSLSDDLIHWTPRRLIMAIQFPPWVLQPVGGSPEGAPCLTYVSLIDAEDTSRNFEITGQRPYLYCVRINPTPPHERQLVRIPIEFD